MRSAIQARGLAKRFGSTRALRGIDLDVETGTVCGLLGPNGAGKTTAVKILATLTRPDSGSARVAGYDVVTQADEARYRIGLAGQHAAVDEIITARDNLRMFGRLYHLPERRVRARAEALLEQFGLVEAANRPVHTFSGGMRRRLDLAASLIITPEVLFLDEPTTGLDPHSRGEVWDAIRRLVAGGTTVLLTTQYLDEADRLADQIVVIDAGQVIGAGTPAELKARVGGERLEVVVRDGAALDAAAAAITTALGARPQAHPAARRLTLPVADGSAALFAAVRELDRAQVATADVGVRRPTLDDVFLRLTGTTTAAREAARVPAATGEEAA